MSLLLSGVSQASYFECSGPRLYLSTNRADFGTKPPVGTKLSDTVIVYDRKVLLSYETVEGLHVHGAPPYRVDLVGEAKTLEETGSMVSGSKIFRQNAILKKVDSLNPQNQEEIAREEVVCRKTWAMVP